ncbi:uncharacterized protein [Aegilops tauschii subsp. strangulata]|nr:putative F-box protein At3g16210 [Aegilops tauschii subsp. strangulata]
MNRRRHRRRRPRSPPAPLENDDLLSEILLRLAPLPSSLPRASAVCKQWRRLVSDPRFLRRFRIHHSRNPPLLGFFGEHYFEPTMDPPNRIPTPDDSFYSFLDEDDGRFQLFGSRHGLVLIFDRSRNQVLVLDPFNGDRHRIAVPPDFDERETSIGGTVFRVAGDEQHFQVVLVTTQVYEQGDTAIARVYSSETGGWGALISILLPPKHPTSVICTGFPSILVGHSLYWLLSDMKIKERSDGILEFDLERQVLSLLPVPVDAIPTKLQLMQAVGGGLGIFFLSKFSVQLWKMETDSDGVPSWVLARTVELDKLLLMSSRKKKREPLCIKGFAEYNSVVFLRTPTDLFTIQLESLQFKKVSRTNFVARYHPFENVYVAGMCIGGGHDGAEVLHNT